MICKVKAAVEKYSMPIRNKTVVVALSGGADSMSLLHALVELKDEYNIRLIACHVNHGIRGEQADSDERFVKEHCDNLGVEIRILKADIPSMAKEQGIGLEECGRRVRYDFFNSVSDDAVIATAHTLSDRCETLLLNETRGTSVRGLRSIPPVRGKIIRPLIDCSREDIEKYCSDNSIGFVTDKTNFDDNYSRNRIRLNVIPQLKKINPSVENSFLRLIGSASEDENYFTELINDLMKEIKTNDGYDAQKIKCKHKAIRSRILYSVIESETSIIPELIHIEMVDSILDGGKTEILGDNIAEVKNGILRFNQEESLIGEWQSDFSTLKADTPTGKIAGTIFNRNEVHLTQIVHNKMIDFDSVIGTMTVRNRRSGDKMRRAGSDCTKSLKKLYNENHIADRDKNRIISDNEGIVWVQNIGCADRCKITESTKKILVIK